MNYTPAIQHTIDPSVIDFKGKAEKRKHDKTIINLLRDNMHLIKNYNTLCLPNSKWLFEKKLNKAIPEFKSFLGLERNSVVYNGLTLSAVRLRNTLDLKHELVQDISFFRNYEGSETFGFVYLDWMGSWGENKKRTLTSLANSSIIDPNGTILSVCITAGREKSKFLNFDDVKVTDWELQKMADDKLYGRYPYNHLRKFEIPNEIINAMEGFSVIPLGFSGYRNHKVDKLGGGSSPQLHYMFYVRRIVKRKVKMVKKVTVLSYEECVKEFDKIGLDRKKDKFTRASERISLKKLAEKMYPDVFDISDFRRVRNFKILERK
jgi:hypothetical protein